MSLFNLMDGDRCPKCREDVLVIKQDTCYCSACNMPPCSACEHSYLGCPSCGWDTAEDRVSDMRCLVKVQFSRSEKLYQYFCDLGVEIGRGDTVIVDSPYSGHTEVKVVEVYPITESDVSRLKKSLKSVIKVASWKVKTGKMGRCSTKAMEEVMKCSQDLSNLTGKEILDIANKEVKDSLKDELFNFLAKCLSAKKQREKWIKHRQTQAMRIDSLMQEAVKTFDDGNFDETFAAGMFKQLISIEEERVG